MAFVEVDLFGVYVAPIAVLIAIAYAIFFALRWVAGRLGWLEGVWHPGLFEFSAYLIILSLLVLAAAHVGIHV